MAGSFIREKNWGSGKVELFSHILSVPTLSPPMIPFLKFEAISTGLNLVSLTHTTRNYQQQKKVFLREGKKSEMRRKQRS